jgi:DDB1- and CUL4-associated factor 11
LGGSPENEGRSGGTALMSVKFSGDGKEIVGGSKNGEMLVYDLTSNRM